MYFLPSIYTITKIQEPHRKRQVPSINHICILYKQVRHHDLLFSKRRVDLFPNSKFSQVSWASVAINPTRLRDAVSWFLSYWCDKRQLKEERTYFGSELLGIHHGKKPRQRELEDNDHPALAVNKWRAMNTGDVFLV